MSFLVRSGLDRNQPLEAGMEGEPTRDVIAHRLDHRVLAVDTHDDELRGGVAMHLDAVTHIHRPSPSARGPVITAGQNPILPDRSSVGRIAVTPRAAYRRPVPLPHVR